MKYRTFIAGLTGLLLVGITGHAHAHDDDWLPSSAPPKNKAIQVVKAPRLLILEICAASGNTASILAATDGNPNVPGSDLTRVAPGECSVISGEALYVSHDIDAGADQPRGYFRYRIR